MGTYKVYILYSETLNKFYVGYSSNLENRLEYHNDAVRNTIWTRRGQPWEEFISIDGLTKSKAIRIEKHVKKMKSKKFILNLAKYPEMVEKLRFQFV